jgi:hypothetical protein
MSSKTVYRWWWKRGDSWEPMSWADENIREARLNMRATLSTLPREWKLIRETTTFEEVESK